METSIEKMSPALFMEDILNLDFTMLKQKLQDDNEGYGWSEEHCDKAEIEYKRFIALRRTYPEKEIVPHKTIDIFWHQHILDTIRYAKDCHAIFGYFVHHFPYFGMSDKEDEQNLYSAFEETKALYKRHFGKAYVGDAHKCKAHKCRTACKPMKCR